MNFLDYPAYVMGCLGIGDIVCSFNALENVGRERERRIDVYVVDPRYYARVLAIYQALDLKLVSLHFADLSAVAARYGPDGYTVFQAFGMDVSWIAGWPRGWGLQSSFGAERMIAFRDPPERTSAIGVSFTVTFEPRKNISRPAIVRTIREFLDRGEEVIYFGFRPETDADLRDYFGSRLRIHEHDLAATIRSIARCRAFIGADSGMAWLAAFHRVPTKILLGEIPSQVFAEIPWVTIEDEAGR